MDFTLQGVGPFLHWLTLGVLFVMPVLLACVLYKLGSLPGAIARARGHPQADAINICGWMGIITIVLWPIAMVWAHLKPEGSSNTAKLSEVDAAALAERIGQATQRLAVIEGTMLESGRVGELGEPTKRMLSASATRIATGG